MLEACQQTGSPIFRSWGQKALDFIALARNPYLAWRYGVKPGDNDTAVTGWMAMALASARQSNDDDAGRGRPPRFTIDAGALDGVRAWIEKVTDPETGRTGYDRRGGLPSRSSDPAGRFPADRSESTTAVGILARMILLEDPRESEAIRKGTLLCASRLPVWNPEDGSIDACYWYHGTLAMFEVGGAPWKSWSDAMKAAIVDRQRRDGDPCTFLGSWDPVDPWGEDGGRVYSTALLTMCLEVYYRYDKVFRPR